MKKFLYLLFLILASVSFVFAKGTPEWKKLQKGLYVDLNSISQKKDTKIASFKEEEENKYEIIQIKAYCKTKVLHIIQTSLYDSDDNLIENEVNKHSVNCDYTGLQNGEIYYKALCKTNF